MKGDLDEEEMSFDADLNFLFIAITSKWSIYYPFLRFLPFYYAVNGEAEEGMWWLACPAPTKLMMTWAY